MYFNLWILEVYLIDKFCYFKLLDIKKISIIVYLCQ